jgi:hypothetical protein
MYDTACIRSTACRVCDVHIQYASEGRTYAMYLSGMIGPSVVTPTRRNGDAGCRLTAG